MDDVEEFGQIVYKLSQEQLESVQEELAAKQREQEGESDSEEEGSGSEEGKNEDAMDIDSK